MPDIRPGMGVSGVISSALQRQRGRTRHNGDFRIALVGNPNSGKTTLFNALTGLHHKVGNYPGVTVERKQGRFKQDGRQIAAIDLPGTYSLNATSGDELVVRDLLLGMIPDEPSPGLVIAVVDASHLERHLFLATQVLQLGLPVVIALTMVDEALRHGRSINTDILGLELGVPVVAVNAPQGKGIDALRKIVARTQAADIAQFPWTISRHLQDALDDVAELMPMLAAAPGAKRHLALQVLLDEHGEHPLLKIAAVRTIAVALRHQLDSVEPEWRSDDARSRHAKCALIAARALSTPEAYKRRRSDVIDSVVTHPIAGLVVFVVLMALMFQAVFSWAPPVSALLEAGIGWLSRLVAEVIPAGPLQGLIVDGVIGGVGAVIVFLPQIVLLFLFIAILDDSGYIARAAYLMNRHMRRAGLHGKAFVALLAGFACAIPGIMAARTISDPRERLVTMLAVPFISCSARLPVYALMISAFVPAIKIFGWFNLQGLVMISCYMFSLAAAITAAWVLRKTVLKGETQPFILELPPYRLPHWRTVLAVLWERAGVFVTQAGTIILAINIILWFLVTFPANKAQSAAFDQQRSQIIASSNSEQAQALQLAEIDRAAAVDKLSYSLAGRMGRFIEPAIAPLGFDWKIGVGLIASFAAREVIVSVLAVIYGVGDDNAQTTSLSDAMRSDINPHTGKPVYNVLVALSLIIFFILACQCMATVATVKRESNSWGWALFMVGYMTALAYIASLVFYQATSRMFPHLI